MGVLVGQKAPLFKAAAVINGGEIVSDFSLGQYIGKKYIVLFFYPMDFTFVCPTELFAFQKHLADFEARDAVVIACSTDTEQSHWGWLQMPKEQGGIKGITYPIVADTAKTIAANYDVLAGDWDIDEDTGLMTSEGPMVAYRGTFIIDKSGVVRHQIVNDLPIGRSVEDTLRTLDAIRFNDEHGEVCPADWHQGEEALKPTHEGVAEYLAKH